MRILLIRLCSAYAYCYYAYAQPKHNVTVLDLVSQVRNVVLMNVYWVWETPGSRDFGMGVYEPGEGNGRSVYEQPGYEVDGSYHSKEGSK